MYFFFFFKITLVIIKKFIGASFLPSFMVSSLLKRFESKNALEGEMLYIEVKKHIIHPILLRNLVSKYLN